MLSLDDVYRARESIGDRLHRTPLLSSVRSSGRSAPSLRPRRTRQPGAARRIRVRDRIPCGAREQKEELLLVGRVEATPARTGRQPTGIAGCVSAAIADVSAPAVAAAFFVPPEVEAVRGTSAVRANADPIP